jgi:hypothetical protein
MRYRCAHCLKPLVFTAEGVLETCPDHPEGGIEVVEPDNSEQGGDGIPDD